jgi:hypothetical protein
VLPALPAAASTQIDDERLRSSSSSSSSESAVEMHLQRPQLLARKQKENRGLLGCMGHFQPTQAELEAHLAEATSRSCCCSHYCYCCC